MKPQSAFIRPPGPFYLPILVGLVTCRWALWLAYRYEAFRSMAARLTRLCLVGSSMIWLAAQLFSWKLTPRMRFNDALCAFARPHRRLSPLGLAYVTDKAAKPHSPLFHWIAIWPPRFARIEAAGFFHAYLSCVHLRLAFNH